MKRIISLLIVLSLLCVTTGCSDRNSKGSSNNSENENFNDTIPGTDTDDNNVDFFITDFGGGKDMSTDRPAEPEILKTYAVSTAEYPLIMKEPNFYDFDENGDGIWGQEENETYFKAEEEWRNQRSAQKNVEGYDQDTGRKSILGFNTRVMKQFLKENDHENRIYSPINIYIALGMLAETSEGNTRQQVLDLLETGSIEELRTLVKGLWNRVYTDDKMKSILASSIWLRDDLSYKKDTLESLAKNYYASSFSGKMGSDEYSEAFRSWLDHQTDGILKEQISGLEFAPETVMALATTVCFCAKWQSEFNKNNTKQDIFHSENGDIQCDFMNISGTDTYFWGDKFGAINKFFDRYGSSMMFILPDEGTSVYDLLADEQVADFIERCSEYEQKKNLIVNLSVPRFDVSSKEDIIDDLKELGITDAFDRQKADFSPVSDDPAEIWLDKVEHGVRVMADEEGVKAAAYTAELLCGAGMPPEEKMDFVLDRPFMFVIRSAEGIPLFVGIVERP